MDFNIARSHRSNLDTHNLQWQQGRQRHQGTYNKLTALSPKAGEPLAALRLPHEWHPEKAHQLISAFADGHAQFHPNA